MIPMRNKDKELLNWAREHRANVELRNKILKGILSLAGFIAVTVGIAGYLNYYMLLEIPNAPIAQFVSEAALLLFTWKLDYHIARISPSKSDAAAALALVVAAVAAVAVTLAASGALALALVVAAALMVASVAAALSDN